MDDIHWATSPSAVRALALVEHLQTRFRDGLERISGETLTRVAWKRDAGLHGGGARYQTGLTPTFDRVAINVSQVHYEDLPERALASASALSTIIHPRNPRAPSVHAHFSFTELKSGAGTWRLMADLNPALPVTEDTARFAAALRAAAPVEFDAARAQGDRYFEIPALGRTRGVFHFYLEGHTTGDEATDRDFTRQVGEAALDAYVALLTDAVDRPFDPADPALQRAYHTLYFFQVLTLDRGTTSGLLVHDQNDAGIMGSLPSHIDRALLASWADRVEPLQRPLVEALVAAVPADGAVDSATRLALAAAVRAFYIAHPKALHLQARGDVVPPTVENHKG
jgi:coproporphyrinogen III oxidase